MSADIINWTEDKDSCDFFDEGFLDELDDLQDFADRVDSFVEEIETRAINTFADVTASLETSNAVDGVYGDQGLLAA